jgi:hypothetical protein
MEHIIIITEGHRMIKDWAAVGCNGFAFICFFEFTLSIQNQRYF